MRSLRFKILTFGHKDCPGDFLIVSDGADFMLTKIGDIYSCAKSYTPGSHSLPHATYPQGQEQWQEKTYVAQKTNIRAFGTFRKLKFTPHHVTTTYEHSCKHHSENGNEGCRTCSPLVVFLALGLDRWQVRSR